MKKIIAALFLLFSWSFSAHAGMFPSGGSGGASFIQNTAVVADLPTSAITNTVYVVTDGSTTSDCTVGGGANRVFCAWTGSAWQALGDGSVAGAGDIGTVGNCTFGDCFVSGSSSTTLFTDTNFIIDLDENNNGVNTFSVRDGGNTTRLLLTEAGTLTVATVIANLTGAVTGNADTATALAANPDDCSANEFAQSIAASGNLTCAGIADADVPDTITIDLAATATALAADPANCSATQAAGGINASGVAEACIDLAATYQPLDAELTTLAGLTEAEGSIIIGNATPEWSTLTIGSANDVLVSDGSTAAWAAQPVLDATNFTNIPAASDIADITNVTLTGAASADVLVFTGTVNASENGTIAGDVAASYAANTLTFSLADDVVAAAEMADADHGAVSWSSGVATVETITVTDNEATDEANALVFVAGADLDGAADAPLESDGDLTYNPSSGTLTTTAFVGALTGNASTASALAADPDDCAANEFANVIGANGALTCAALIDDDVPDDITIDLATLATTVTVSDDEATDDAHEVVFTTDNANLESDGTFNYNPSSGTVAATVFAGSLTGTASGNLALTGGTLTGEVVVDNLGLEFTPGDDHTDCSAFAATGGGIFYDDSEGIFKKCQDNVLTDLDTSGAIRLDEIAAPNTTTSISLDDTETITFSSAQDTAGTFFTISLTDSDGFTGEVKGILITTANNDNANYAPFEIQDDSGGTPDDLFTVDSDGDVLMAGNLVIGDNAAATMTITGDNSGSVDPVITLGDGIVNVTTGELQEDGAAVLTEETASFASSTLYAALSDPSGSGGAAVFATGPTIATPALTGKIDNSTGADDDDCTGEQGKWWFDSTDNQFEFCNANSGTPDQIGGDVTAVGDCASGACFVTGGSGTTIESDTSLVLALDADNDGSETLTITDGADATVVTITEAGAATFASTVTASGFIGSGSATPTVTFDDSDSASITDDARLIAAATTTANPNEDTDLQVWVYLDGTSVMQALFDGDVGVKLGDADGTDFVQVTNAGVMTSQGSGSIQVAAAADVVDLETVVVTGVADTQIFVGDEAGSGAFVTVGGDMSLATDGTLTIDSGTVGRTEIDEALLSMQVHATDCTALTCDAPSDGEMCYERDADAFYICDGTDTNWVQIAGTGMTSFDVDGDNNDAQTVTNGAEVLIAGGSGITTAASATNTVTVTWAPSETNTVTLGSGTFTDLIFNAGVTDPVITAASGSLTVSTGTFTSGSNFTVGNGTDVDNTITFNSDDSDGVITNMADEGEIRFSVPIVAPNSWGADIAGGTPTLATTDQHGRYYLFTAADTVTLDAAADVQYGATVCFVVRDAAEAAVIDIEAGEKINLDGTALAVGVAITATGAGEKVCMVASTDTDGSGTDGYYAWGNTSGWASE